VQHSALVILVSVTRHANTLHSLVDGGDHWIVQGQGVRSIKGWNPASPRSFMVAAIANSMLRRIPPRYGVTCGWRMS
jgi:hypothetical protein